MKTCPFCNATNEDDAFYCRECDNSIAGVPAESDVPSPPEQSGLSLADEERPAHSAPRHKPTAKLPAQPHEIDHSIGRFREGDHRVPVQVEQQPKHARPMGDYLTVFLLFLVLILGGVLVYLIFVEHVLEKKEYFDEQLSRISGDFSARLETLKTEIDSLRAQRDQLTKDLSTSEERHKTDMDRVQNRLNELISGKIPGTYPLSAGGATTTTEKGIKYIVEFLPSGSEDNILRYRITVQNIQGTPLSPPPMDLVIFNENGLQIGMSSIAALDSLAPQPLDANEAKVVLGSVRLRPIGKPRFFLTVSGG